MTRPTDEVTTAARDLHDNYRADVYDWRDSLRHLTVLRQAIEELRTVEANIVRHVYLTGEHGDVTIEGLGRIKITRGRERKRWDERGVAQAVLDARLAENGGELPNDPWQYAEWLLEVMSMGYARVTPLRALGLDPSDYCEEEPGKPGVSFLS